MEIHHQKIRLINLPKKIVFENFIDLDHINFVHKRCYSYCNIVRRNKTVMLCDVGVFHLPPLPIVTHYTMFHEIIDDNKIIHFSKRKGGNKYVKSTVEFKSLNNGETKIIHSHILNIPSYFFLFKWIIIKIIDRWSDILWKEDSEIMKQRYTKIKNNFKDGPHCGRWILKDGIPKWEYNKI